MLKRPIQDSDEVVLSLAFGVACTRLELRSFLSGPTYMPSTFERGETMFLHLTDGIQ